MKQAKIDYNSFTEELLARYRKVIEDHGGVVSDDCERIIEDGMRTLIEGFHNE
jgi:hypothetical protein